MKPRVYFAPHERRWAVAYESRGRLVVLHCCCWDAAVAIAVGRHRHVSKHMERYTIVPDFWIHTEAA